MKNESINASDVETNSFIASGVACFAFSLIDDLGLLDTLVENKGLAIQSLLSHPNPPVLKSAFLTLELNNIIQSKGQYFHLTKFGMNLYKHRGTIGLIYSGYRKIFCDQSEIAKDEPSQNWEKVDSLAVARASIHFGDKVINQLIIDIIDEFGYKKGICDLGCGFATRLINTCNKTGMKGIGLDLSSHTIKDARKRLKENSQISVYLMDITKIKRRFHGIYILTQEFVMHDLNDND